MSDDPMYRRGNPNARPGQPGAQQRPDDRYYQQGQGAPQDPYARGADTSRPPAYSGYRQPYPEPERPAPAPVPDYRQSPPPFSAPNEGRPVEHRGYHDNGHEPRPMPPRQPEPARAPAYDPQAAYYQGEEIYQNQYAEQPQAYAPPPPSYQAPPPPDYGQREPYRPQAPAPAPQQMGYGGAPSNGMSQNADDIHSRFFLSPGGAPQAPQERAPAPPPLPQSFDFPPAQNNGGGFYQEAGEQVEPEWDHYDPDPMLPPAAIAPDRRHDDDLDADFFADEEDFETTHAYAMPEKKGGRLKMVLAVLLGTAVVGGGGMYGYKMLTGGRHTGGDAATIAADSAPLKAQPDDPGGRQFANQGKKIYERLENMTDAKTPDGVAAAAPPASSPSSFDDRLNQAMQRENTSGEPSLAQPVDPEKPRTVKTETYRPDGSRTETPPPPFPGMTVSGEAPPPAGARHRVAEAGVSSSPSARPVTAPEPQQYASASSPSESASAPLVDGYYLQLSSTQDQARAGTEVTALERKYATELGGIPLGVKEGTVGSKTYYRIKAGPLESKEAGKELCDKLKTAGMKTLGPCLVHK